MHLAPPVPTRWGEKAQHAGAQSGCRLTVNPVGEAFHKTKAQRSLVVSSGSFSPYCRKGQNKDLKAECSDSLTTRNLSERTHGVAGQTCTEICVILDEGPAMLPERWRERVLQKEQILTWVWQHGQSVVM